MGRVAHNKFALDKFSRLLKSDTQECVLWEHSNNGKGYGMIYDGSKHTYVHRLACIQIHGAPPSSKHVAAHSCRNRNCMNPKHLRWATPAENTADMVKDGTVCRGERSTMGKLTEKDVLAIRSAGGLQREIADEFGVTQPVVSRIKSGAIWGWL